MWPSYVASCDHRGIDKQQGFVSLILCAAINAQDITVAHGSVRFIYVKLRSNGVF